MNPDVECASCVIKWVYERAAVTAYGEKRFQLMQGILDELSMGFSSSANVGALWYRTTEAVREFILASAEHYNELKLKSNRAAKALLGPARDFIDAGESRSGRFERACCLASVGNVAPIGAPSGAFKFQEVGNVIAGRGSLPIVVGNVYEAAQRASHVLYFADNAGEIGFDALLIAMLKEMDLKVTLIVKEDPFFDDTTIKDASFFGLDKLVDEILTVKGVFVPGDSTPRLTEVFTGCDFLITKGTGNYEALKGEVGRKPTIYMLKIKCNPIAKEMDANIGSFVVKLEK